MQIGSRRCAVALAFTFLLACDDGGGGPGASGVDSQKLLVDLDDADAARLCAFDRDLYKADLPDEDAYCTDRAFDVDAERCVQDVADCVASEDYESELEDDWQCDQETVETFLDGLKSDCLMTVADVEACIRANQKQSLAAVNAAVCDGMLSASEKAEEYEPTPACAKLDSCFEG